MTALHRVFHLGLLLFSCALWAAEEGSPGGERAAGTNARYELGAHVGNLLPNHIDGVTEILGLGGFRGAMRIAPLTYAEAGMILGNGNGVEWKNVHVDVRMDIPVENLVGVAYVGFDTLYYKGNDGETRTGFGGHAGGGIQALLSGALWVRGDMKFGFSPGTSLYVGFGLVFRFGGGASSGSNG